MAIVVGSIVTPRNQGPQFLGSSIYWSLQPPVTGSVEAVAGTLTVLWQDGSRVASIAAANVDELLDPEDSEVTRLEGKRVIHQQDGAADDQRDDPAYSGIIVNMYIRAPAGIDPTSTLALVWLDNLGVYREYNSSELFPAP
jgi:hypothetical protein